MSAAYDVAIVGGGFSGLATAANIVREAKTPMSVAVISRDPKGVFGPAYSTPRPEHLLNVHAKGMGLFTDNHRHFLDWALRQGVAAEPDDFLPRPLYGEYLKSVLADTQKLAKEKHIAFDWFQGEAEDIHDRDDHMTISSGQDALPVRAVVLAIGNSLKAGGEKTPENLIDNPWHYDFSKLGPQKNVAVIGSGLTAADIIISILDSGWEGKITCLSGGGAMPKKHLIPYDISQRLQFDGSLFISHRLSQILRDLRNEMKTHGRDWHYVIDSLRPLTQDIWRSLPETDRQRLAGKYFTLWNIHRHRYAPQIGQRIDDAIKAGKVEMVKARVTGTRQDGAGVALALEGNGEKTFDLAFKCTGVNYDIDSNPLLKTLADKGMVKPVRARNGLQAYDSYAVYRKKPNIIYALGAPLFGQLFETTAVPELREQAHAIATVLCQASASRK